MYSFLLTARFIQRKVVDQSIFLGNGYWGCKLYKRFVSSYVSSEYDLPYLSSSQVTERLQASEYRYIPELQSAVQSFECNYLSSNSPCEDQQVYGICPYTGAYYFGIVDGHGGIQCAESIRHRLLSYISACLMDRKNLLATYHKLKNNSNPYCVLIKEILVKHSHTVFDIGDSLRRITNESLKRFVDELVRQENVLTPAEAITMAFERLDSDIGEEACAAVDRGVHWSFIPVEIAATSGCCVSAAVVQGNDVYVASAGDCAAVMGSQKDDGQWYVTSLSSPHICENQKEIDRVLKEHPSSECRTVIRDGRLLGQLMPLRAMGDFRYKWSLKKLDAVAQRYQKHHLRIPCYFTPPYLTCVPEVTHTLLTSNDKFIIIATDGLWDFINPSFAVQLVGDFLEGRLSLNKFEVPPDSDLRLRDVAQILDTRVQQRKKRGVDENAATHLIRSAIGFSDVRVDSRRLSLMLSLPKDVSRMYRDDITVCVILLRSDNEEPN